MKKLLYIALPCLLTIGFSSCETDGSGSSFSSGNITGTWDQTRISGWIKGEDGQTFEEWDDPYSSTFVFDADGSGSAFDEYSEASFTWKLTGNTLTLDSEGESLEYSVERADLNGLILSQSGRGQYQIDGPNYGKACTYYEKMTFARR
jgi:hypothetical protein